MYRTITTTAAVLAVTASSLVAAAPAAHVSAAAAKPAAVAKPAAAREQLVRPQHLAIDKGLSKRRAALSLLRVRQLYTFWDTGDVHYLHRADSPDFVDYTLPAGRPQGRKGIELASRTFRAAVPDLRCTVADVLITGDRASVRQVYSGHFTGTFTTADGTVLKGKGQTVRFNAFDIQQIGKRQITGDWHLEDNLTFMTQIGAVK